MTVRSEGRLRVIGGQWRSRVVDFDPKSGVRPTPDRVRQTLFDWLAPRIDGARCLDLFAGSGALGIEALSRGAAHCSFVDEGHKQADAIRIALRLLQARHAEVMEIDAVYYLAQTWHRYDVVFVDPPYGKGLLERVVPELPKILSPHNRIYLEWPRGPQPALPPSFEWLKDGKACQVCFGLATYHHPAEKS